MKKALYSIIFLACILINKAIAQEKASTDTSFKPSGKLWGYTFGDIYYKAHSDTFNRGGTNHYTGIEQGRNAFEIRRAYLGYNYNLHPAFSAELLLAAEDNVTTGAGNTSGDLTSNNKITFYIKYANIRWKNIWHGTDLIIGQHATPAFPLLIDTVWGYRSIERTITDIRRTSSYDLGASLQGKFDPETGDFGYNVMVGNGNGARPENDKFKWFYGDVYAKLFNHKLILDVYVDYQRLNWSSTFHHSLNMLKGFAAYTTSKFTLGVEAFVNHNKDGVIGVRGNVTDTLTAYAVGISVFVRGTLIKDKLGYFARADNYNPYTRYNAALYQSYKGLSANYEPNNKEEFFTAGLDFTPIKGIHFMPNIWYNNYINERTSATGLNRHDYDLAYRITFYYVYGK